MNRTVNGHQLCTGGSERITDEFLENRAANPRDYLRDEDEGEYCDQQSHDEGRWQNALTRFRDVCDDRPLVLRVHCFGTYVHPLTLYNDDLLCSLEHRDL